MLTTFDLCKNIEEVAGWKMTTPRDFDRLSDIIFVHVHERVSPTTLKRLWGYVDEDVKPRRYTLDALSRFLGYNSFDEYCKQTGEPQSGFVQSVSLKVEDLQAGNRIDLRWAPDRQCLIRYLGDARFAIQPFLQGHSVNPFHDDAGIQARYLLQSLTFGRALTLNQREDVGFLMQQTGIGRISKERLLQRLQHPPLAATSSADKAVEAGCRDRLKVQALRRRRRSAN